MNPSPGERMEEGLRSSQGRADCGSIGAGWQDIATAPKQKGSNVAPIPVLLSWTYVNERGEIADRLVGEGYFLSDDEGGGDWWWANTAPGDYYHDPISQSITGQITHWAPMPMPPEAP